jgi:hypothetical protein
MLDTLDQELLYDFLMNIHLFNIDRGCGQRRMDERERRRKQIGHTACPGLEDV